MMGLGLVLAALLVVMTLSELALRGTKLQTGLGRVLVVWTLVYLVSVYPVFSYGGTGPIPFTIFWGGAFLSWFGVRSHIESSILLRMLFLLRKQALSKTDLLATYNSQYGPGLRLEELFRGNMATKDATDKVSVTGKGKSILRVVEMLR